MAWRGVVRREGKGGRFRPCGHLFACEACARSVRRQVRRAARKSGGGEGLAACAGAEESAGEEGMVGTEAARVADETSEASGLLLSVTLRVTLVTDSKIEWRVTRSDRENSRNVRNLSEPAWIGSCCQRDEDGNSQTLKTSDWTVDRVKASHRPSGCLSFSAPPPLLCLLARSPLFPPSPPHPSPPTPTPLTHSPYPSIPPSLLPPSVAPACLPASTPPSSLPLSLSPSCLAASVPPCLPPFLPPSARWGPAASAGRPSPPSSPPTPPSQPSPPSRAPQQPAAEPAPPGGWRPLRSSEGLAGRSAGGRLAVGWRRGAGAKHPAAEGLRRPPELADRITAHSPCQLEGKSVCPSLDSEAHLMFELGERHPQYGIWTRTLTVELSAHGPQ